MRRFFLNRRVILSDRPTLTGPDVRHIRTVLRLKPGEDIFLFDGEGSEYRARITSSTPKAIILSVLERSLSISEPLVEINIGQGLLKARKMDRIVRQVTELGIHTLTPVLAKRCVPKPRPERWAEKEQRWETIARESLKQCGRSKIPRFEPPTPFQELISVSRDCDVKIIFHQVSSGLETTLYHRDERTVRKVLALVGPEGGFTPDEVQTALEGGFVCVSLGPRILKADTAIVAACTILQYAFGDIGRAPQEKS
jgi:16S rRNA (uracil1498-N3)-methyltransferase